MPCRAVVSREKRSYFQRNVLIFCPVDIVGVKTKAYNLIDVAGKRVQLFDPIRDPMNLVDISDGHPEIV